ncbi:MAG: glycosyltransferase family A protein [bacterium]|nr:glycosyltransferase family A protein [bacterium]
MISVIIPTYNRADQLPKTLDAIFTQNYKEIEVIVVNDGCTDDTENILAPYWDRIHYFKQENKGAPVARNLGFRHSKGAYLMFADDDQEFAPHAFSTLVSALETHPDASYAYYSFYWGVKLFPGRPFDADFLRRQPYIHTSALIRREQFPGFDESIKKFQDWDLWLTMLEQGHTGYFVDDVLATIVQRKAGTGISTWMPKIMYKIPWKKFGIHIKAIEKYETAMKVIQKKHKL